MRECALAELRGIDSEEDARQGGEFMKDPRDLIRAFRTARISRREFVERPAEGTLGLTAPIYSAATAES
jgi:hypothetical protein